MDTDQIIAELPDPDKYYGKDEDSDGSGDEEDDDESEDDRYVKLFHELLQVDRSEKLIVILEVAKFSLCLLRC